MASSKIATAYVQVMPSMEGVAPKVKSFFGSAGSSSGSLFGANFGGMIKNALVSAGIGTAIKETILEGADLQQSQGGIDTLFKDSAETVKASAANAYKTAGLSANEYMESVTSFSASLIKSLGDDTAKAASMADMALTDMSDNANKMGSSMESIQNAYQGFAKQNYTMLDNLKLGYGGTKSEMQRLLKDAQKLTGVKYDINNLSDVYAAIHAVQEELGITGATAAEASTTLTGSFNAMKAAFSNVLGNLTLGNDIKPSLVALADTTKTFLVGNLAPAVKNIITGIPGACTTFLAALIPENVNEVVSSAITSFTTYVTEKLPQVMETGGTILATVMSGIAQQIPNLTESAKSIIKTLSDGITNDPGKLFSAAGDLFNSIVDGILELIPTLVTTAIDIISNLGQYIVDHKDDIIDYAKQLGDRIAHGIWDGIVEIWNKICDFPSLLTGIPFITTGGLGALIGIPNLMARYATPHAKGLDYVPYDGYLAELHKGEMVLTSKQADAVRGGNLPGRKVVVNQYIYSEAKTSADLMREARYQQELAVMMNV